MSTRLEDMLDVVDRECASVLQEVALAESIAWQIAKDEGASGVTLEIWERAVWIAQLQLWGVDDAV